MNKNIEKNTITTGWENASKASDLTIELPSPSEKDPVKMFFRWITKPGVHATFTFFRKLPNRYLDPDTGYYPDRLSSIENSQSILEWIPGKSDKIDLSCVDEIEDNESYCSLNVTDNSQRVCITQPYLVASFPVTVEQYRCYDPEYLQDQHPEMKSPAIISFKLQGEFIGWLNKKLKEKEILDKDKLWRAESVQYLDPILWQYAYRKNKKTTYLNGDGLAAFLDSYRLGNSSPVACDESLSKFSPNSFGLYHMDRFDAILEVEYEDITFFGVGKSKECFDYHFYPDLSKIDQLATPYDLFSLGDECFEIKEYPDYDEYLLENELLKTYYSSNLKGGLRLCIFPDTKIDLNHVKI